MLRKKFLKLNDIGAYKISFELSNYLWKIIKNWSVFEKKTIGGQFIRSVDSISANIAECFGRHNKKDKIHFYRISRGSVMESLDWNEKAKIRNLLQEKEYHCIFERLKILPKEINSLIAFTNKNLSI